MSETCRVIINQVKQKLHLVGYLLTRCLHQLFSSCIIIFPQNHQADQFFNAILMKLITCSHRPSTQICLPQFLIFEPPYPASYRTHINALITINGLHSSVNFNGGTFSAVKNSITARCLNRTSENSSISMCAV